MAEYLKRQPKKGILKNSSSFESNERQNEQKPATKWDEMNILATLHPAGKDYGHMKIEEPKTPYNYAKDTSGSGDELDSFDADLLAQRMQQGSHDLPRAMVTPPPILEDSEEEDLSPEEREIRKHFEVKRKKHYNEFQAVKLARKLMEQDTDDEEDDNESCEHKAAVLGDDTEHDDTDTTVAASSDNTTKEDTTDDAKNSDTPEKMED